jgi:colanic acid/amylovoran biosynthesis glycosyltransferase
MEGFGMVFAEAQALGTPVVSFAHAAIPEVVNHGKTGLLCTERDIDALSESLSRLLDSQALWAELSQRGSVWVKEQFNIAQQTRKLESLYDECIALHRNDA